MEEKTFLNTNEITVTNARFVVPSQTYAVANITSVKNVEELPKRFLPICCGIIGALLLTGAPGFGVFLVILAVFLWVVQKPQYHVQLTTAAGETRAFSSRNQSFIMRIVEALNDAIVARG